MGASILVGGATTFLAVVPLSISSVKIFMTVFNAFFAMVTLGVTHGLILLPVILSYLGPTTNVRQLETSTTSKAKSKKEGQPELPQRPTFETLGSRSLNFEGSDDGDGIHSLTVSIVPEVCDTNHDTAGSPTKDAAVDTPKSSVLGSDYSC
jgi:hypothetical protein